MKKSTDDLLKSLQANRSLEEFFKENSSELLFDSLPELIEFYMKQKGLEKKDVVRRSMLSSSYAYNIINGDRKNPDRDKLIMLCFGLKLTSAEANVLLRKCSVGDMYPRIGRDDVLIHALDHNLSVIEANNLLDDFGFDLLPLPK